MEDARLLSERDGTDKEGFTWSLLRLDDMKECETYFPLPTRVAS